jgi:hypothetical protein
MHNWSTNERALKKNPKKYIIWRLEQLINFGLGDEKLDKRAVKKYWSQIKIDPSRRAFISLLLQ